MPGSCVLRNIMGMMTYMVDAWLSRTKGVALGVLFGVGVLALMLTGCEQAPPPPPPPSKVVKTEPPPPTEEPQEEEVEVEPTPTYEYDPSGRREPFKTLIVEQIPETPDLLVTPDPEILRTPLQKFEVQQLQIVGIILGGLGDYARVIAPDGESYTIDVGTPVGKNEGEVISIDEDKVDVKEILRYESGKVEEAITSLYLNPGEEEGSSQ
ncbi:hypothetical protein GF339_19575 [candidate division KSB3 bacterium]|uniref:Pilus assembly protein PilP n=1 Tax=candidate division KSB3 bacterium TaxID=2044937 RepID=A0A9D5JYY5_9BACT|nr:hypothetical protein [candidate division KSB3 bacterium]